MTEQHVSLAQSHEVEKPHAAQAGAAGSLTDSTIHSASTLRPSDDQALAAYLREVRAQHRLSADEEQHLAAQLTAGRSARQRLHDTILSPDQQATLREVIAVAEAARQ